MFIEKGMFTINDHAYVLTVKPAYKKTIALEWFVDVAEKYTKNCVTSKDANGTFSKEVFLKEEIDVEWFEKNIHRYIEACITSRGTNGTFSKEQFLDTDFTYPSMIEQKKIVDIYKSIDDLNCKVFDLCERIKKLNGYVIEGVTEFQKEAGKLFDIKGGNSGLTEEFIYNNQPINEEDAIVVYSSSTDETTNMGVISKNSKLNPHASLLAPP